MQTETCPACDATIRDRGRRWLGSLLLAIVLAFGAGVATGWLL